MSDKKTEQVSKQIAPAVKSDEISPASLKGSVARWLFYADQGEARRALGNY